MFTGEMGCRGLYAGKDGRTDSGRMQESEHASADGGNPYLLCFVTLADSQVLTRMIAVDDGISPLRTRSA